MRYASLLVLVLLAVAGCDSSPAIDPPMEPPVLPLAVGNEWTLTPVSTVRFDRDGLPTDTADTRAGGRNVSIAVIRDTVIGGETWYRIETSRGLNHCVFSDGTWLANRTDGLYRWQESPDEVERAYGIGLPDGEAYLDTPIVLGVLDRKDATYTLSSGTVEGRLYGRTWRRLEFNETARGPIEPNHHSQDFLSPDLGIVALEVAYVQQVNPGAFAPVSTVRYELTASTPTQTAHPRTEAPSAYPAR